VALKVPNPGTLDSRVARQRFLREAKAAARLCHPHIVPVYDTGEHDGRPFIASAYITGKPLSEVVREGPLPPRRAARVVWELATGLAYAHGLGVVHRDVKPHNVMIGEQGEALLLDFGLAHQHEVGE
jgi:serine/threonine-protein kinase